MTNDKQRERLVELIGEELLNYSSWSTEMAFAGNYDMPSAEEVIADKLLADGWMRPPCKVGDVVYWLDNGKIKSDEVFEISIHSDGILIHTGIQFCLEQVYLTREEAEAKLKEGAE